jgi:hypothetical protein
MLLMLHRGCLSALRSCYFCAHAISGFHICTTSKRTKLSAKVKKNYKKQNLFCPNLLLFPHQFYSDGNCLSQNVWLPLVPWPTSVTKLSSASDAASRWCGIGSKNKIFRDYGRRFFLLFSMRIFTESLFELAWMLDGYTIIYDNIFVLWYLPP